jgi:hypothetical protein
VQTLASRAGRWTLALGAGLCLALGVPAVARAADLHATPSTLSSVFSGAKAGDPSPARRRRWR